MKVTRLRVPPSFDISYKIWISRSSFLEKTDEDTVVVISEKLLMLVS